MPLSNRHLGCFSLLVVVCLAIAAPLSPAHARARRVAVLPLSDLGVGEDVSASLLGILRAEVARLPGVTAVDPMKAGRTVGAECKGALKCLAAAGLQVNADELIYGTVAGFGDQYSIALKRLLVRGGREQGRVTELLSGEREMLIDGVRAAAFKLLLPTQFVGTVQIELEETGADVYIDGELVGTTPLTKPVANLSPGQHALKIVKQGFADFDKFIDVRFARVSVVKVNLKESAITGVMYEAQPDQPGELVKTPATGPEGAGAVAPLKQEKGMSGTRKAAIATTAGAGGALAIALFSGLMNGYHKGEVEDLQVDGGPVASENAATARSHLQSAKTWAGVANLAYIVGGAGLVAGGVLWLLPEGNAAGLQPTVAPTPGGASVGVSGVW